MADQTETLKKLFLKLKQTEAELESYKKSSQEPIAVIGMSCRFPGGVNSPEDFWELIVNGKDAVEEIPTDRWNTSLFYDEDREKEGKMYVKKGGFLSGDLGLFDNQFFSINAEEAEAMDPQQRYLLELSYEAFQNAGIPIDKLKGSKTGVFVGISNADYAQLNWRWGTFLDSNAYSLTGTSLSTAAGRLSYVYGLEGPNFAVDTACSSSLVALHNACMSLRNGESTMALAGGVNMILCPDVHIVFSKMNALSEDGHCKPFDQSANGFIRSEGCGLVVLKRLSDAVRDGDHIHGLIRGSAINQDGQSNGLTAPNGNAQQKVILSALKNAGVAKEEISYIEAHGTGTPLGDSIEVEAILGVLEKEANKCWLGSVKANIGHTEAAAGMAGFIKSMMMLRHQTIPRQIHFNQPSEFIDWGNGKLVVPTKNEFWDSEKRLSGLSSFGFGGTNAHIVLEEYTQNHLEEKEEKRPELIVLSAKTNLALKETAARYAEMIGSKELNLGTLAYNTIFRTSLLSKPMVFVEDNSTNLQNELNAFSLGQEHNGKAPSNVFSSHKVAFVFSGQGGQWQGMGRHLYETSEAFRKSIQECEEEFSNHVSWKLTEILMSDWQEESRMGVVQPILFALQVGIASWWKEKGIEPKAIVGQSMGEVAAHYIANGISLADASAIICKRSKLLEREEGKGAMALIQLSSVETQKWIETKSDQISIAVDSSPFSTVVAGASEAILQLIKELEDKNIFAKLIKANVASHSPLMDALKADLTDALIDIRPQKETTHIYSSVTAQTISGSELTTEYWVNNLRKPVLLRETIGQMLEDGYTTFIEISPHPILEQNLEQCFEAYEKKAIVIPSTVRDADENGALLRSMGILYSSGYPINWKKYYPEERTYLQLPTYPWQRKRFWTDKSNYWPVNLDDRSNIEMTYSCKWIEATVVEDSSEMAEKWLILSDEGFLALDYLKERNSNHSILQREDGFDTFEESSARLVRCYRLEESKELVDEHKRIFSDLLSIVQRLNSSKLRLSVVMEGPKKFKPVFAAVQAFIRSLSLEKPETKASILFVGEGVLPTSWNSFLSSEVTLLENLKVYSPVIERVRFDGVSPKMKLDKPYLVTGGLGSLGRYFSEWLIEKGAKHLILTTRSVFPEKSEWSSSQDERVKQLLNWEERGVHIDVRTVSLVSENEMREIFESYQNQGTSIAGVIHSAGEISEVNVQDLTIEECMRIHEPKTQSAFILHNITLDHPVDFMLFSSSVSAVWGSGNLTHYASANAFLDGLAELRNEAGHSTISINWGAWQNSTMAAGENGERLSSTGIRTSSKEEMLGQLDRVFQSGESQLIVADMDWELFLPLMELSGQKQLFNRLRSSDLNSKTTGNEIVEKLVSNGSFGLDKNVNEHLKKLVAEYLGIEDTNELDVNLGFFKMGFTSISAVSFIKRLKSELNLDLPSTLAFDFPTITQLSDYLSNKISEKHFEQKDEVINDVKQDDDLSFEEIKKMMEEQLGGI